MYAHRLVWMQDNGPLASGQVIMHACDNPACVNPAHLSRGTQKDNSADMMAKGRGGYVANSNGMSERQECAQGHEYTYENTAYANYRRGRICKTCERERKLAYFYRQKAAT